MSLISSLHYTKYLHCSNLVRVGNSACKVCYKNKTVSVSSWG